VVTPVTRGTDVDGGSTASTASYTPKPGYLYLLAIASNTNLTADPNAPTATGNGMTWTQVATVVWDTTGPTRKRITLFAAMHNAPTVGAISIDCGGQAQTIINWTLDEQDRCALTSNSNTLARELTGITDVIVTLSAFSQPYNLGYGVFVLNNAAVSTLIANNGMRIVQDHGASVTDLQMCTVEGNRSRVEVDWGSGAFVNIFGAIAVELASAPRGLLHEYPLEVLDGPKWPRTEFTDVGVW
jgi:hypothetical protein